jgi:arylsulfatase A-like enzyme
MIRVPLIVKLPGSRHSGLVVDQVTRAIDVMPTVLAVAGASAPSSGLQGEDLTPLWRRHPTRADRVAFTEGTESGVELKSMRTGTHKLILEIGADSVREHGRAFVPAAVDRMHLFDLTADPGERLDLLSSPSDAESSRLAAELAEQIRETVSSGSAEVETIELDDRTLEELKALGYVR